MGNTLRADLHSIESAGIVGHTKENGISPTFANNRRPQAAGRESYAAIVRS